MSPDQLKALKELSQLLEEGTASSNDVKQLTELLGNINQLKQLDELNINFTGHLTHVKGAKY